MAKWDFVQNTMNYVANEHWDFFFTREKHYKATFPVKIIRNISI